MPPTEPAMLPRPMTEATALLGKMSDAVVKRFADQAWCEAPASPISITAGQPLTWVTARIGSTRRAKMNSRSCARG